MTETGHAEAGKAPAGWLLVPRPWPQPPALEVHYQPPADAPPAAITDARRANLFAYADTLYERPADTLHFYLNAEGTYLYVWQELESEAPDA